MTARFLTLNTHSWMEVNSLKKLFDLGEYILEKDFDVVCLQEINQGIDSELAKAAPTYQPLESSPALRKNHFALQLVQYLKSQGKTYYWSWAYNHICYDKYHEGVAILSKTPLLAKDILISATDDETNFNTRRALLAETEVNGKVITVVSAHMSLLGNGFETEWPRLEAALSHAQKPLVLMGAFNNPTDETGYRMIMDSPLQLQDSHAVADKVVGQHTIIEDIDGWEDNTQSLKVDHVFASQDIRILASKVAFDGGAAPIVSDHYGLEVEFDF